MAIKRIDYEYNPCKDVTLKQLLTQATRLTLPDYQRSYVYGWVEAQKFINFVLEAKEERHDSSLGQIVTYINTIEDIEIIDGQQRITTFFIGLLQIYRLIQNKFYNTILGTKILYDIKKLIISDTSEGQCVKLCNTIHKNHTVNAILNFKIQNRTSYKSVAKNTYSLLADIAPTIEDLYQIYDYIINHIHFTCYECKSESEALIMFNNINKSGKKLSTKDNVKSIFYVLYNNTDYSFITMRYNEMASILGRINIISFIELYTRLYEYGLYRNRSIAYAVEYICKTYFDNNCTAMLDDMKIYAIYYAEIYSSNNKIGEFCKSINKKYHVAVLSMKDLNKTQTDKIIDELEDFFEDEYIDSIYRFDYALAQFAKTDFKTAYANFKNTFKEGAIETNDTECTVHAI